MIDGGRMSVDNYHVYCKNILGVRTNVKDFKWLYGSFAPYSSVEDYETCLIKINVQVKSENCLNIIDNCDKRFQSYAWNSETKTISCRRTLFGKFKIGFNIKIDGSCINAEIGRNYYKYIKNKMMNLHGVYYLLSDLANILLIKNGYLPLYASAVYYEPLNRCVVHFAPPNTGKTVTAMQLSELPGYRLVGEDILIASESILHSCPWTSSYRKKSMVTDDAGSLGRVNKLIHKDMYDGCSITDLVVLSLGKTNIKKDKKEAFELISILNGYMFGYFSSPILKMLAYFDEEYRKPWNDYAIDMVKKLVENCNCLLVQDETAGVLFKSIDFEKVDEIE